MKTKKQTTPSNPLATIGGILVLTVIGFSAKHCMKKYGGKKALKMKISF